MENLDALKSKRKVLKSSATKLMNNIYDVFENSNSTIDMLWLEDSLAQINDKENQFLELCKNIEGEIKDLKSLESDFESNQEYREKFISVKTKLNRKMKDLQKEESNVASNLGVAPSDMNANLHFMAKDRIRVNLPKLNIEKFDGNLENWQEFYSQFKSAIHGNDEISKIDKFTYLKSLLKSEAQIAIQGLLVSEENYDMAVNILESRYGKKEILIRSHVNKLLNLPPVRNSSNLKELRNLYDTCEIHIRSLKSLGIELESYGSLLFPIITKLIPNSLMLNYNRENKNEAESWNVSKLLDYLRAEIETRDRTFSFCKKESDADTRFGNKVVVKKEFSDRDFVNSKSFKHKMPTAATLNTNIENKCMFCSESHDIETCSKTIEEKKNAIKSQARCFLCLKRFHLVKNCKSKNRCKFCFRRHNSVICEESENKGEISDTLVSSIQDGNVTRDIYLQTATALAIGKEHKSKLRLLYDLGSQRSFILSNVAEKLGLQVVGEEDVTIHAFGSKAAINQKRKRYRILLKNPEMLNKSITIEVLETPEISEALLAVPEKRIRDFVYRNKLQLADRTYGDSKYFRLSILIGSDYYWKMVTGKLRRLSDDLVLSETILGWTVNGSTPSKDANILQTSISVMKTVSEHVELDRNTDVNNTLKAFWELETMGIKPEKEQSDIEDAVLENYNKTVKFKNNVYQVQLPWNERVVKLTDNYELARKRLYSLNKKFEKCPEFYEKYSNVIDNYLEKGMAEVVNSEPNSVSYYMPHQAVIREDKSNPNLWSHCPGSENPADLLTRGEKAESFLKNEAWFNGPKWLKENETFWPQETKEIDMKGAEVEKRSSKKTKILQASCVTQEDNTIFKIENYSTLTRVLRITCWIFRFANNTKTRVSKLSGPLSAEEMLKAEKYWIKQTQEKYFPEEREALLKKKLIPRKSKILNINPFLDEDGIMRLKGRLQNSNLNYSEAHPIILPSKSHFTDLQIRRAHEEVAHAGVSETLAQLRESLWIIKGRQQVKRILRRCIICKKFSAKPYCQDIAPLPPDRIKEASPFEVTGADFLGPLYLKNSTKIYVVLFTCAVVRAVHLEIVMNLTTTEFLMAFRRFISRRGICKIIYTDNAKTFKKADRDLQQIWNLIKNPEVQNYFSKKRIEWKFIVERAAWWGGFYERLVRSTKICLKKILGRSSLDYKEFETTLQEVEAVLNSRPLTFVSSDVNEPTPLCPAHFLVGKRLTALPPEKIRIIPSTKSEVTRRYRYRLNLVQKFWLKWKQFYLMDLKSVHYTDHSKGIQVKKGAVVQIKEDNQPRLLWKLGIVTDIHPGRDGKVRACTLRLSTGNFIRRAVQHLYPLELDNYKE